MDFLKKKDMKASIDKIRINSSDSKYLYLIL